MDRLIASTNTGQDESPGLGWLIWETFQYTHRSFDNALRPHGLTSTQLGILNRVAAQPGLSGAELARITKITAQAANLTLLALERKRLVERTSDDDDSHILRTFLTDEGHKVMRACSGDVLAVEHDLVAALSEDERAMLGELLRKYLAPWAQASGTRPTSALGDNKQLDK